MPTEVQKFLTETQRQIDEEGLLGMSGTHFDRGDSPFRVIKAKQFEARMYSGGLMDLADMALGNITKTRKGKFSSVARIAQELNAFYEAFKNGDVEELLFDDSSGNTGVNPFKDDIETYMDDELSENAIDTAIAKGKAEPFKFNDSTKFGKNDPRYGCDDCCDFEDCWPNEEAVEWSRKAQKIIMDHIAAGIKTKKAAEITDEVERILQLEKDGKTQPYYDY